MAQSTTSKKSKPPEKRKIRRVNWRALAILGAGLIICLGLSFPVKYFNAQQIRSSALAQAKDSREHGDVELAIRHLDRYLADQPDDVEVLRARADLVVTYPRSGEQLLDAANTLDRLLRIDPDPTDRDATRRNLAEIYVRYSDFIKDQFRRFGEIGVDQDSERKLYRYTAAVSVARQLLDMEKDEAEGKYRTPPNRKAKPTDGDAHRILAMALEGQDSEIRDRPANDSRLIQDAIENYKNAIRINPLDLLASERLAILYLTRLKDPARAEAILDDMLKADKQFIDDKQFAGSDLRLMPSERDVHRIPMAGKNLVIVANLKSEDADKKGEVADKKSVLHFRIFDPGGKVVVDTDTATLATQPEPIAGLKKELEGLWPPHELTGPEKERVVKDVASIIGLNRSVQAHLVRHELFVRAKRDDPARAELEAALALSPESVLIRLQAARLYLGRRDPASAREHLKAIPPDKQNDLNVKVLWGYLEFAEQHPDEAIDQWRRGLTLVGGGDLGLTWQLAFNLIQLGRLREADPLVKQYNRLAKGDKNRMGRFLVGVFELASGRVNEATQILEKIKDLVPAYLRADTLLSLAKCYEQKGEEANALIAYRNAATAAPSSPAPRLEIARLIQKRHPDDAISEVDRALSESPDNPNLLIEMLRLRINKQRTLPPDLRQWAEVKDILARAKKLAKNNWVVRNLEAEYLANSGEMTKAVDMLGDAAKGDDHKRAEAWISWAQGLERMNRREDAVKALDQGALPENAGDRAILRIAKARLLARSGKGQAAREVLTKNLESVPQNDLAELAQAKGELLRELGDREGCRDAYVEWARLAPRSPKPGLALFDLAQIDHDEQAAKLGLEALRAIGGANQPYGMAARAFDLLRTDPAHPGPPSADRLDEAEALVDTLRTEAPALRIGYFLKGMIQSLRGKLEEAVKSYQAACKDDPISSALPHLIEAYMKLKRYDDLDRLRRDVDQEAQARHLPGVAMEFDRIAALVALKVGDKDRADFYASRMVEGRPNSVQSHAAYANMLYQNGKPEEALRTLQQLTENNKNDPVAWLTLIAFEAIRKTPADVTRTIEKARKEYKGERPELFLAQCYWLGNDIPNAKTAYKNAVELRPEDLVTLRSQVEFYISTKQSDQLDPVLRKVLKVDPTSSWAARLLADRLSSNSDSNWSEAWALVAPGSPASGDTPEDRLIRATILARSPESVRRADAIPAFISLAKDLPISSPLAIDTRIRLSQAMLDSNRLAEAWEYVKPIADDLNRPNPAAMVIAIEALARAGKPDEAERRLERLALLDPKSPQLALSKGWVLMGRGKASEASATVEAAYTEAKDNPRAEEIGIASGQLLIKFNDLDAASRLCESVARRWPRDAYLLARVQLNQKKYEQAMASCRIAFNAGSTVEALRAAVAAGVLGRSNPALLKQAVEMGEQARAKSPKSFTVLVFLASLRHLEGRYEDEMALYREAQALNPQHVEFLNNMAWTLCEGLGKPDEALKQIDEAIRREGRAPQYIDTRGVILSRQGKFPQAIADLEESVKADPSPTTYFHLARAYYMANNPTEYRRCRDLAIKAKFDPNSLDPTDRADLDKVMGTP